MTDSKNNYIDPTAIIGPKVVLGSNNYIGPYCVIGAVAEHRDFWDKEPGWVSIGDNNRFTGLVTIDAGTEVPTVISNGVTMLKHSHVGHDAHIEDGVTISCGAKIGGHARIGERSNIGLNACIHQKVIVPEGCMVGMGAVVTKKTDLQKNTKYAGVPARAIGPNIKK